MERHFLWNVLTRQLQNESTEAIKRNVLYEQMVCKILRYFFDFAEFNIYRMLMFHVNVFFHLSNLGL